jgi:hypothetical protein
MPRGKKPRAGRFAAAAPIATGACAGLAFQLISVRVRFRQDLPDHAIYPGYPNHAEWTSGGGGAGAACIRMRTTLRLSIRIGRVRGALPNDHLVLRFQAAGMAVTCPDAAPADDITIDVDTNLEVGHGVAERTVRLNKFTLKTTTGGVPVGLPTKAIDLRLFTVFDDAIGDNVKETTLVGPGVAAGPGQVVRLQPFLSVDHLRQVCTWAQGASRLHTGIDGDDIVKTIVLAIPPITYGEAALYYPENDGWNVWDNPGKRTGDCSQQASFIADVLGTIGIRAHDFELKCEYVHTDGNRYRRYFGDPNPDDWPCHGVVLVRNGPNAADFLCYDTSFNYPRIDPTITQALAVGPAATYLKPGWQTWCLIPAANPNDVQGTAGALAAQLTTAYDEATWRAAMLVAAGARFPVGNYQADPGP